MEINSRAGLFNWIIENKLNARSLNNIHICTQSTLKKTKQKLTRQKSTMAYRHPITSTSYRNLTLFAILLCILKYNANIFIFQNWMVHTPWLVVIGVKPTGCLLLSPVRDGKKYVHNRLELIHDMEISAKTSKPETRSGLN